MAIKQPRPPFPKQHLVHPGLETELKPHPHYQAPEYKASGKLQGKVALITGGDSGIGRAVAGLFAKEGADVAITYLEPELEDAEQTYQLIEERGQKSLLLMGDLTDRDFCEKAIEATVKELGRLDILVSNAAYQDHHENIADLSEQEWHHTFRTNIDALFYLTQAALPHLHPGSCIIATSSITGLTGSASLVDYASTKGAINAYVKSLAKMLVHRGIRVNAVAPGPVWTPLNPSDAGLNQDDVSRFGAKVPYGRPAQPEEIAPAYVFLASEADSSYITGAIIPELGGEIIN